MKTVEYIGLDGKKFKVEYDENATCISCGLPVIEASMGGTALCPWCDCGQFRDGTKWNYQETVNRELLRKKAKEIEDKNDKKVNDKVLSNFKGEKPSE